MTPASNIHILLLEDETAWAIQVQEVADELGWQVEWHRDLPDALAAALDRVFDLVIIDRQIDGQVDGLSLLEAFRKYEVTPLTLVVSQLGATHERVAGLSAGADDYLPKPYDKTELKARLVALARRSGLWSDYPTVCRLGALEVRQHARTATWKGESVRIPEQLFDLLWLFVSNRNATLSREMIWREVWTDFQGLDPQANTIEVAIGRLRRILADVTGRNMIKSVRGQGYRWADD
ncbi:MAG: response regulator transcription factor [Hyphomonadaceae bacterium]|nr:response regulator transcription factor [Hyphomonadaceae bacterium]